MEPQPAEALPEEAGGVAEEASSPSPSPSSQQGPSSTKLFLGGLSWQTTDDKLRTYFSKFGTIEDAVVMVDRVTRTPRGFGFITFKEPESATVAVQSGPHLIDDRLIDLKPSIPVGQQPAAANRSRKIFVGGLAPETTEEEFRAYFSNFGTVVEAQIMIDPTTHRPRGFGFVTYDDEQCVHRVFSAGAMHVVSGKQVEVKAATPKGSGPQASAYRTPPPGAMPMPAMGGPVMQQRVQQGRAGAQGTAGGPGMSGRTTGGYQAAQQTPYPMPGYPMAPGYGFPGMMFPGQYGYPYGMPAYPPGAYATPAGMMAYQPGPGAYGPPGAVYGSPTFPGAYPGTPMPMFAPMPGAATPARAPVRPSRPANLYPQQAMPMAMPLAQPQQQQQQGAAPAGALAPAGPGAARSTRPLTRQQSGSAQQ